ncbi:MAG TPA: DUF2158 domain-containing protein [Rhizomicrobium sp.]|jgi:uncharacterized protein YodC (DUF2158 family)|nr:DUF2158 domain-containing protein [Rhizomicrobium sp.]
MINFNEGDTVRLKSGGPLMTVTSTDRLDDGSTLVYCVWFDDKKAEKTSQFRAGTLVAES